MKSSLNKMLACENLSKKEMHLLSESVVVIGKGVCGSVGASSNQRSLGLGSLALLATLLSLLLLHLLVAQSSERARDLLDLITRQLLGQLLAKFLKEQSIMGLLGVSAKDGDQRSSKVLELQLGLGVEKWQGADVDGVAGVLRVYGNSGSEGSLTAVSSAEPSITKIPEEGFSVMKVSFLLGAAKTLTLFRRSLFFLIGGFFISDTLTLSDMLSNTLGLRLLVGGGLGSQLGLYFFSLASLLSLDFGVFGSIPRIKNLKQRLEKVVWWCQQSSGPNERLIWGRGLHRYHLLRRQTGVYERQ